MPNFSELGRSLERAGALMGPSQTHGTLCGVLCTPDEGRDSDWLQAALGETDTGDVLVEECRRALQAVYMETLSELDTVDCRFDILLPGDDEDLGVRTEALRDWCEGFIFGLGIGGVRDLEPLPEDSREIIHDITEMTRVDKPLEVTKEDEEAYAEIVEYIRVGVMLVRAELVLGPPTSGDATSLH